MPVSSSTVAAQIVFEPDIGGYSVGSMMMNPASQSGRVRRHDEVGVAGDAAARLVQQQPPQPVAVAPERLHLLEDGRAGRGQHAAGDDVSDLAPGVAPDDRDHASGPHARNIPSG